MSIQTPDQRIRVFVSSTLQELAPERQAAREAIESLRLTPVMFEEGARPHPPRDLYRAYLEQSDVFIGLYWERYGWVAPGEEVSGLEDEYGLSGDRPKLIYVKKPANKREERLTALIDRIRSDDRVSYRAFGDPLDLRSLVADDLAVLISERFAASTTSVEPPAGSVTPPPRPLTRLIGRDEDLARVLGLLRDPESRLVTILGPGGIGKSRLALGVAERAGSEYPGGVAYVDLAAVKEPSQLLPAMASALGVPEHAGVSVASQLHHLLDGKRMLVVLDNMEQLVEAAGELSDLLAGAAVVQVLVTSRRLLDIRGERVFEIAPLEVPSADGTMTSAVELFIERARAIKPDYEPDDDDLTTFGELSRRLDGLPLAIELASAQLRTLSPHALLERMGDRPLELLRSGPRDLPPRQRTLRDTIAWSHSLLSPDASRLFARLAVFVGSADLEAIRYVSGPEQRPSTLELLTDLVDDSLVQPTGDTAEPRFGMLETIREYATEQLDMSGEAPACRERHATYYLALAERGRVELSGAGQVAWLDRLDRENDEFRAVLRRAVGRDEPKTALRMAWALTSYWFMRGRYREAHRWTDQIAGLPSADASDRANAWMVGAIQSFLGGDFRPIERGLDDAMEQAADRAEPRTAAFARFLQTISRGVGSAGTGWQDELSAAARRLEREGEPLGVAAGLVAAAAVMRFHGRSSEARRLAQDSYDLATRIGDSYVRTYAAGQLARTAIDLGDIVGGRRQAVETLRIAHRLRNAGAMSYALELWATAELREGHIERSAERFALGERGFRQAGSEPWHTEAVERGKLAEELSAALGARYQEFVVAAREADFDEAVDRLLRAGAGDGAAASSTT